MKKVVLIKDCHLGKESRVYNFPDSRSDYLVRIGLAKYKADISEAKDVTSTELNESKQAVVKESTKPKKKRKKR